MVHFKIILLGRNHDKLIKIKENLKAIYPSVTVEYIISDAKNCKSEEIDRIIGEILIKVKKIRNIRLLINNVGMGEDGPGKESGRVLRFEELNENLDEDIINVNCIYSINLSRRILDHLKQEDYLKLYKFGIVNIASLTAVMSFCPYSSLYASSKELLRWWSESLRGEITVNPELGNFVQVWTVTTGFVETKLSRMSKSLFCCDCDENAIEMLNEIFSENGIGNEFIPHWKHRFSLLLLEILDFLIPEFILMKFIYPKLRKRGASLQT